MRLSLTTLLAAVLLLCLTGCANVTAHDPANQAAISGRERVHALWQGYDAGLKTVDQLYRGGQLSKDGAVTARNVLVKDVRPLIQTAQAALVNGNPEAAIAEAEKALQNILDSLNARRATTRPVGWWRALRQPGHSYDAGPADMPDATIYRRRVTWAA